MLIQVYEELEFVAGVCSECKEEDERNFIYTGKTVSACHEVPYDERTSGSSDRYLSPFSGIWRLGFGLHSLAEAGVKNW